MGTVIHQGGVIAKLDGTVEIRSPITGRLQSIVGRSGQSVTAGEEVAVVAPGTEQVWEALRALYFVGQPDDLPAILPYEREQADNPDRVRLQAQETERAIRERSR